MIKIEYKLMDLGIYIQLYKKGLFRYREFDFLEENYRNLADIYEKYPEIMILEELYLNESLELVDGGYLISFEEFYKIDNDDLKDLNIFEEDELQIILETENHINSIDFKIKYRIKSDRLGLIDSFASRKRNIYKYMDYLFLLREEEYKLLELIDNYKFTSMEEQYKYIAEIKEFAGQVNLVMEEYISNENIYVFKDIDLDIKKHSDLRLELLPQSKNLSSDLNHKISNQESLKDINSFGEGLKRERIFVGEEEQRVFNQIKESRYIEGSDVPRFLDNPSEFIPEEIDLEEFSERVKGLGIYRYEFKSSVNVSKENDWFDFEIDYQLDSSEGLDLPEIEDKEEYEKILHKAIEEDEDYVYHDGNWIKLDRKMGKKIIDLGSRKHIRARSQEEVNYILEIFDNIENLDYSEEYLRLKESKGDWGVFTYEKPDSLKAELYDYQKNGFVWLKELRGKNLGALLADDMGLGKTLQVIAYFADLLDDKNLAPSMAVLPKSLIDNWKSELSKFLVGDYSVLIYHGPNRIKNEEYIASFDIVLTTYDMVVRDQLILGKIDWNVLVLDEIQRIKNASTYYSNAAKALKAQHRIGLTGTPVENNLSELWSIVDFIQPGLLSSYKSFKSYYQDPIESGDYSLSSIRSQELIDHINPILLRRMKEDEIVGLPEKRINYVDCEFGRQQLESYKESLRDIKPHTVHELLMISSHHRLKTKDISVSTDTLIDECPKLEKTLEILNEIKNRNEKVIIFTKYKLMQRIIKRAVLDRFNIDPLIINGDVTTSRLDIIDKFSQVKGFNVIILSPQAAGVGLNIVAANNVIHYTREWNPAIENQATDRAYRIGQEKDVNIYYPTIKSSFGKTVEEELSNLLMKKQTLSENIIVPTENIKVSNREIYDSIMIN